MSSTLYYVHDPMCSWCWGHRPLWDELQKNLPDSVNVEYLAGGLASDTNLPMAQDMREAIQGYWREIQQKLGTEFNFDFWKTNIPRRSTYIACRAVIAAKNQKLEAQMIDAIQRGYYLRALNPSDSDILLRLCWDLYSQEFDIDLDRFTHDLESVVTHKELQRQMALAKDLGAQGFPSLVLEHKGKRHAIVREYQDYTLVLDQLNRVVSL